MKARWTILIAVAVGLSGVTVPKASAEYAVGLGIRETSDFRGPLAAYGNWVQTDSYGVCWYPAYVDSSWRPYTNGSWQWTDDGWYWASDEPWAWATYHYGRWVYDSYYGWLWTPGTQWAPAWVSWREGDDYVGWAPLPPGCDFGSQGTTIYAEQIVYAPNTFVFVERRHFCEPIRPIVLIVNQTIVNRTVNITRIQRINQVVINNGPRVDGFQQYIKRGGQSGQVYNRHVDISSVPQRGHIPDPRERPDRPHDTRVSYGAPQNPSRDLSRDVPIVREPDRPRDNRQPVAADWRAHDNQARVDAPDYVKQPRDLSRRVVVPPTAPVRVPPVAQSARDNGRYDAGWPDKQQARDIDDDSPRKGHRN